MDEEILFIRLEQIPGGVRLTENFSERFVKCIREDSMHESMLILQGLISLIGEISRSRYFKVLYPLFGCSVKTLKQYLCGIAEQSSGDHLFDRGHGRFYDELIVEGSVQVQLPFSYEVVLDPEESANMEFTEHDRLFINIKTELQAGSADPAVITAAAFAEALYGELYFPALKLLTGDETNEKIRAFISSTIDAQFIPFV